MNITEMATALAQAEQRLREAWDADMSRPYLVEHHMCSRAYTFAWYDCCEARSQYRRAMERGITR